MELSDFELLTPDTVSEHVFDITINRAPPPEANLGFYNRVDGETVIQLRVPATNLTSSVVGKRKKGRKGAAKGRGKDGSNSSPDPTQQTIDIRLTQSMSLLNSRTETSTTGAMLWKVSVIFAEWFYENLFYANTRSGRFLEEKVDVVELGCGAAGLLPMALAESPRIRRYIATDQPHITKLARQNIARHYSERDLEQGSNISVVDYDWEDAKLYIPGVAEALLPNASNSDEDYDTIDKDNVTGLLVIACDTVYNEYLIPHFLDAAAQVCALAPPDTQTHLLVAQQVRDPVVLEAFMTQFVEHPQFKVWSVPESLLSAEFNQGYVLHYATFLRDSN